MDQIIKYNATRTENINIKDTKQSPGNNEIIAENWERIKNFPL